MQNLTNTLKKVSRCFLPTFQSNYCPQQTKSPENQKKHFLIVEKLSRAHAERDFTSLLAQLSSNFRPSTNKFQRNPRKKSQRSQPDNPPNRIKSDKRPAKKTQDASIMQHISPLLFSCTASGAHFPEQIGTRRLLTFSRSFINENFNKNLKLFTYQIVFRISFHSHVQDSIGSF